MCTYSTANKLYLHSNPPGNTVGQSFLKRQDDYGASWIIDNSGMSPDPQKLSDCIRCLGKVESEGTNNPFWSPTIKILLKALKHIEDRFASRCRVLCRSPGVPVSRALLERRRLLCWFVSLCSVGASFVVLVCIPVCHQ